MPNDHGQTGTFEDSAWPPSKDVGLEQLFRRHRKVIQRLVARLLVNPLDSDDVLQDAFLAVWKKMIEGVARSDARAYLFRTAINSARDKNRSRRRIEGISIEISPELPDSKSVGADDVLSSKQRLQLLEQSLKDLTPTTRGIFVFYHVEGLSVQEIALRTNRSTRTIERHLAHALAHCTRSLQAD